MTNLIEQIAAQWDGCMYEGVGGDIDIGQAIRDAGKDLAKDAGAAAAEPVAYLMTRPSGFAWALMPKDMTPEWRAVCAAEGTTITPLAALTSAPAVPEAVEKQALIDWVVGCWHAEVAKRPLVNVHRRSLDDTWRQMLRHLGVDDRARLGPTHDELLDAAKGVQPGERGEG